MFTCKNLFEIPVYRLAENEYYQKMSAHISEVNTGAEYPTDENYLRAQYGGDWQYNEIIGFLRFYRYGARQIRCEYWETGAKRKVLTRKKVFVKISDSYCKESFSKSASSLELANTMKRAVEHCGSRLKNRILDLRLFDSIVNYIDWKSLLN
jgi:hypothetical protein